VTDLAIRTASLPAARAAARPRARRVLIGAAVCSVVTANAGGYRDGPGRPGSDLSWRPPFHLRVAGVGDRALPLELIGGVQLRQQQLVQLPTLPACCQVRSLRQAIIPQPKPSSCGTCSQPIPVCSTNKIPCKTLRSSRGLQPG